MTGLDLFTEPYGSTGNIGENFLRLLGTPNTDALQTAIREAVQNIADAAKLGVGPDVLIRVRRLNDEQLAFMRERVFAVLPEETNSRESLKRFLGKANPAVLEICDFRTTGLGGPTRADRIPIGTTRTDFINFLRNIGTPRDTDHGGGTYGFGKAALYSVSDCRTILVDTCTEQCGSLQRRVIGCHIGSRFEQAEEGMLRQYTGRHWWGVADSVDGIVDPALDALAEEVAEGVGLPARGEGRTGTSIMILDYDAGNNLVASANQIVEGLLWSFWPRMMRDAPEQKRFSCRVFAGDEELPVPAPEDFPPLDLFCQAMQVARSGEGRDLRSIGCERPIRHLGNLVMRTGLRTPRRRLTEEQLFPPVSHHIALMRPVELVVKYLSGAALPDDRFEWAGVFLVDSADDVEVAFARAEPPAHDDWIPANMEKGWGKTFVRVALGKLQAAAHEMGSTGGTRAGGGSDGPPLAKVAGRLGAALMGVVGDGAGARRPGNRPTQGKVSRPTASRPIFVGLGRRGSETVATFASEIRQDADRSGIRVEIAASIAVDGSAGQVDEYLSLPRILSVRSSDLCISSDSGSIVLDGYEGTLEIEVTVPDDCAVTLDAAMTMACDV